MNLIMVSGSSARARTFTLDWRHGAAAGAIVLALLVVFTLAFNYVTLRWAAAVKHPWLQAIVLADQREEAQRIQSKVEVHLNTMALKLGDLEAQVTMLNSLGERLARVAGLKLQELPTPAASPGRGGALSTSMPSRAFDVEAFAALLQSLGRQVDQRSDQLSLLEALLIQSSANRNFLPSQLPVVDGLYSSNFGYRVDPFTGQQSFHEGLDFPAATGTAVVAAASGKVIVSEWHPQYGNLVEVDHGNGLVTRYAHSSVRKVQEGDLVVRGQPIAAVGSTGRSTGSHLHFEVRLNGVPQNPARFLQP